MKQKQNKKKRLLRWMLTIILLASVALVIAILFIRAEEPPIIEIENAKKALVEAGSIHAEKYSPVLVNKAKNYYDLAISNWTAQNLEWFFQRDFSRTRNFANLSEKSARDAIAEAVTHEANLSESLAVDISSLKLKVKKSQFLFKTFPLNKELKNSFTRGEMLLSEAVIDYNTNDLLSCKTKVARATALIDESIKSTKNILKNDFRNYNNWLEIKDKTIRWSKQNGSYACLVDKYNRKCYIYKSGKLVNTYSVELGPNWIGAKQQSGDNKTPEGMYKVSKKKSGVHTRYYKALLIDYPNDEDVANFKNLQKKGLLSKRTKSGGLIEIHGDGGKGFDWTNGCVALTNSDMDKIYNIANVGMPVNIVGSLTSLNEILSGL
jgi:L,D-peptidoglycan transpeptidase YkuD (ErfK/YbiS/YcfS/YnhG family)